MCAYCYVRKGCVQFAVPWLLHERLTILQGCTPSGTAGIGECDFSRSVRWFYQFFLVARLIVLCTQVVPRIPDGRTHCGGTTRPRATVARIRLLKQVGSTLSFCIPPSYSDAIFDFLDFWGGVSQCLTPYPMISHYVSLWFVDWPRRIPLGSKRVLHIGVRWTCA